MVEAFFALRVVPIGCEFPPPIGSTRRAKKAPTIGDHYHYHGMILTFGFSLKRALTKILLSHPLRLFIVVSMIPCVYVTMLGGAYSGRHYTVHGESVNVLYQKYMRNELKAK